MPGELEARVSRELVQRKGDRLRTMELVLGEGSQAVFQPTRAARRQWRVLLGGIWSVVFTAGLAAWLWSRTPADAPVPIGRARLLVILAVAGSADIALVAASIMGVKGRFGPHPLILDRGERRLWQKGRKGDAGTPGGYDIRDVGAVQLCSGKVEGGEVKFTTYEINLVFARPPGERLRVVSHADEAAIRDDARELARFLRVPLLDHAGPINGEGAR